jgi:hypothetical protein
MPQTIGIINGEVDSTLPIKETEDELVIPAILAREGVLSYSKGNMLRSKEELRDALFTFSKAWVTAEKHPEPLISIITDRKKQIKGDLTDIRLDENAVMPNGKKSVAVKANVHLIKKSLSPQFIDDVKTGRKRDVSVGFLFDTVEEKGNWQGEPYDFKQENILINHVAVGVPVGRMRAPFIGLGCDQADLLLAESLIPQVEKHPEKTLPATESSPNPIQPTVKETDARMGADPETTQTQIRIPVDTCKITSTITLSAEQGISALYCTGEKKIHTYLFDRAKGWDMPKAQAWVDSHKETSTGADAEWDTAYVNALPDSAFAHVDDDGTRHMPFKNSEGNIDATHLKAALAAVSGARQSSPPPYASAAKKKLCAAVRSYNTEHPDGAIESTVCDTEGDSLGVVTAVADSVVTRESPPQPSVPIITPTTETTANLIRKLRQLEYERSRTPR